VQVMGVNGVSHHVVADDLEGASAVLQWLSTMPPMLGTPPAHLPTSDPLDRGIGYSPAPGTSNLPRYPVTLDQQSGALAIMPLPLIPPPVHLTSLKSRH